MVVMEGMVGEEVKVDMAEEVGWVALVETVPMAIMHLELVRTAEEEGTAEEEVTAEMEVMGQGEETLEIQQMEVMLEKLH